MHHPALHLDHRLSDWPKRRFELVCLPCKERSSYPHIRMVIEQYGDLTFRVLLTRMRCKQCGKPFAPVYLLAGWHRQFCGGAEPDWALELRPRPKPLKALP